eukprot:scaffold36660_cov33-Tisochrysis_lutea.AAC.5
MLVSGKEGRQGLLRVSGFKSSSVSDDAVHESWDSVIPPSCGCAGGVSSGCWACCRGLPTTHSVRKAEQVSTLIRWARVRPLGTHGQAEIPQVYGAGREGGLLAVRKTGGEGRGGGRGVPAPARGGSGGDGGDDGG